MSHYPARDDGFALIPTDATLRSMSASTLDALAVRLRPFYRSFLEDKSNASVLTGHSHQAWPDASRIGQLACWDDAARLIDGKWEHIFSAVLPEFASGVCNRVGSSRPTDLALAPNTHELVYRLASCFPSSGCVVTSDCEFYSLDRQLARLEEDGLQVIRISVEAPGSFAERFLTAVDEARPQWAAVSQVFFTTSRVLTDLPTLLEGLDERSIPVLVDAYHAFNVLEMTVDDWPGTVFVTGGGYKYAQMGEGAAWMLLPPNADSFRPVTTGWFSDFDHLERARGGVPYGAGGRRFFGATFDPSGLYRAVHTLRFMDEQGLTPAVLREQSLRATSRIIDGYDCRKLSHLGIQLATPREGAARGGFVALRTPRAAAFKAALAQRRVFVDCRQDLLRMGPAPYTTSSEIDRALDVLLEIARNGGSEDV